MQAGQQSRATGPVLFAYDGTELAAFAIEQAADQLVPGRDALVVCVWQPADVGFVPVDGRHLRAAAADEVRKAAEETAAQGASLAAAAGFEPRSVAVKAAPTWQGIVSVAEERGASLIVLGSHCRTGLIGHLQGSVASATVAHARVSVLVVHRRT
jgi:nucleotide-binding universal stress UspA family protein